MIWGMEFRPRPWPEIRYHGEARLLEDPLTGLRLRLSPLQGTLLLLADGRRGVAALLSEAGARHPGPPEAVDQGLRGLLLLGVIEGSGAALRERLRRQAAGVEAPDVLTVPGARFACQGSGACCQGYAFGPLGEEEIARIEALPVGEVYPELRDRPWFIVERWGDDGREAQLATDGERCVFHRPDGRCGLHAAFGADAKPAICRRYPLRAQRTAAGLRIYDKGECARFSRSSAEGPSLEEEAAAGGLLAEASRQPLHHPLIFLDGDTPCDHGALLALQAALGRLLDEERGDAAAALAAAGRLARRWWEALRGCPLGEGEPDRSVAAALAAGPAEAGGEGAAGRRALRRIAAELLARFTAAPLSQGGERRPPLCSSAHDAAMAPALGAVLAAVRAAGEGGEGGGAGAGDAALPPLGPALGAPRLRSLRYQLFAERILLAGRPLAGLARVAFAQLLAACHARALAAAAGAAEAGEVHFDAAHSLAQRVLRVDSLADVFLAEEASAFELIAAAAELG